MAKGLIGINVNVVEASLVPAAGFFLFRRIHGVIVVTALFLIIAFLFWTPVGNSLLQYEYTTTFKQRFPIIYVAFFVVGFIFETVRARTQESLVKTKEEYEYLYRHDMLTGLYNRYGFNQTFEDYLKQRNDKAFAFAIMDIDYFKNVNDKYGHMMGDVVLKEVANRINECIPVKSVASRWGGEEFSILFKDETEAETVCNILMNRQRNEKIVIGEDKIIVKLSIGLVNIAAGQEADMSEIIKRADDNLYNAKRTGRDKLVITKYTD